MKKGAASFYIVAFSTLILMIIATSFAMVIISEVTRSANDDLSQSAYDSALAGVEDAKVAYSNYRRCKEMPGVTAAFTEPGGNDNNVTCPEILYWMEQEHQDCYMVAHILGRITKNEKTEVELGGTETARDGKVTTTNQAYTCVTIDTEVDDYRATLGINNKVQTINAAVGNNSTNDVSEIEISWYTVRNDMGNRLTWSNFDGELGDKVTFGPIGNSRTSGASLPPTLEVQILQTKENFNLSDFSEVRPNQTNRATLYLVPTATNRTFDGDTYYHTDNNVISSTKVVETNDKAQTKKPFTIHCPRNTTEGFYCTAKIQLPQPYGGGSRSNKTFMISVALPYQQPDTDFSIRLFCGDDNPTCGTGGGHVGGGENGNSAVLKNTQISIDSTGRANDLYRRVETRLETSDTTYASGYPYYALEILGDSPVKKDMTVEYERKCLGPWCYYF